MSASARLRWRVAYQAIRAHAVHGRQDEDYTALEVEKANSPENSVPTRARARWLWRVVHRAIRTNRLVNVEVEMGPNSTARENVDFRAALRTTVRDGDLPALRCRLGGVHALVAALGTDPETGIPGDDRSVTQRCEEFGRNVFPEKPPKRFVHFVLEALLDVTVLILLVCAAIMLGIGIKQRGDGRGGLYEGGGILIAVVVVVVCSAVTDFRQEMMRRKWSKQRDDALRTVVVRGGRRVKISAADVVVGDVVVLNIGDQVPADGLFLRGYSLQVDESSLTGESELAAIDADERPFLLSGATVADGSARMVVTAVGMDTVWGEMMGFVTPSLEETPLQLRLGELAACVGKVGLTVAFLVLVVMLVRYFTGSTEDEKGNKEYNGKKTDVHDVTRGVVEFVAVGVAMLVVSVPEGLPLAVTLTLAHLMKRSYCVIIRRLAACETMGSATVICTDKTGMLTVRQMKATKFLVGEDFVEEPRKLLSPSLCELISRGVGLNTTASIYSSVSGSEPEFCGSPTEEAILSWGFHDLGMDSEKLKSDYEVLRFEMFNSEKKRSGVLVRKNGDNTMFEHWKGAADIVLERCSSYCETNGTVKYLDESTRSRIEKIIEGMAASSLRCIAFAQSQVSEEEMEYHDGDKTRPRLEANGLTLLGVVGLKNPCQPGVKQAVEACKSAGVTVKMITGDSAFTARAIAVECGILEPRDQQTAGRVVEGVEFRNYTEEQKMKRIDSIRVLARSSPTDKLLLVQCLRRKGHVVALTGGCTDDAPALREADVGLSMGIQGTEVAKQSSDVVVFDDSFTSVAIFLLWGRCLFDYVQNLIQFRLTVNISALVISFITAVSVGEVPLTPLQLLWVNLIADSLGALALATEWPRNGQHEPMNGPPVDQKKPLITSIMWRNISTQSAYQIAMLLILHFMGESIFHASKKVKSTIVFNTFVLCQVFNELNSRSTERQNVFRDVHRNWLFIGILGTSVVVQVLMVEFMNKFADTKGLNLLQWLACVLLASLTLPLGWFVKSIPVSDKVLKITKDAIITAIVGAIVTAIGNVLFNLHKKYHTKH